ncbi:uncharacterized protein LOC126812107 isoform X1 [Patella vulgata]|uniref:uncharacterized protein LOC126812107 isoform X1 n=1 Tax=Patella vulgata TaxID=6465 RepID=UPI0024A96462|nr:uncharacterized protein LOC126812107 isoform X1 [Patella vulgata]
MENPQSKNPESMSSFTKNQRMLILLAVLSTGFIFLWYNEYVILQPQRLAVAFKSIGYVELKGDDSLMGENSSSNANSSSLPTTKATAVPAIIQSKKPLGDTSGKVVSTNQTNKNTIRKSKYYSTPMPKSGSPVPKDRKLPKGEQIAAKNHKPIINATAAPAIIQNKEATNQTNQRKKYLIYLCDNSRWCGGWGDRQRGIVTVYLMSLAYNRTFGIEMTSPCDVRRFIEPNQTNWIIPPQELVNRTTKTIDAMGAGPPRLDHNGTNNEDVIKIKINADAVMHLKKMYPNQMPKYVHGVSRAIVFRRVWKHLMKPSQHIIEHLKQMSGNEDLNNRTHQLVCAHLRIGKSKNLPNDPPRINISSIDKLWTFLHTFENSSKIFIATDNEEVRVSARKTFGPRYFDTGGKIIHIDRQRWNKEACLGFETTILDQIILSSCDVLVISPSNFSVRAAMLKTILNSTYQFAGQEVKSLSPQRKRRSLTQYRKFTLDVGHKLLVVYVL